MNIQVSNTMFEERTKMINRHNGEIVKDEDVINYKKLRSRIQYIRNLVRANIDLFTIEQIMEMERDIEKILSVNDQESHRELKQITAAVSGVIKMDKIYGDIQKYGKLAKNK